MDYFKCFSSCAGILMFLCMLSLGNALECYTCHSTISTNDSDPCQDIGILKKCTDPAICLSASYSIEDKQKRGTDTKFSTIRSCYMASATACDSFLKQMKTIHPDSIIELSKECFTCSEPGCNKDATPKSEDRSKASISTIPKLLFVILSCCLLNKL